MPLRQRRILANQHAEKGRALPISPFWWEWAGPDSSWRLHEWDVEYMRTKNSHRVYAEQGKHFPLWVHRSRPLSYGVNMRAGPEFFIVPSPPTEELLPVEPLGRIFVPTKAKMDPSAFPADTQGPHTEGRVSQLNFQIISILSQPQNPSPITLQATGGSEPWTLYQIHREKSGFSRDPDFLQSPGTGQDFYSY